MNGENPASRIIKYISIQSRKYYERELARYGLSGGTHVFLLVLSHEDGLNQSELTQRIHFDKANTTRMIKKLEELGYVSRRPDERDGRAYRIFLTEKARTFIPEIKTIFKNWMEILTAGFSEEEKAVIHELLARMADNAAGEVGHIKGLNCGN